MVSPELLLISAVPITIGLKLFWMLLLMPTVTMVYHHVYDLILVVRMCVCGDSWKRYEVKDVVHTLLEVALTTQELNASGEMYTAQ